MNKRIWLSPPHMGGREQEFVKEAFDTNWIAPVGPNIIGFEKDIVRYSGVGHAVALSSGTAAIHLALIMLGVNAGDEVICPTFTFSASANPVVYQGAIPVFVDSESKTWNMDPELLERAIIDRLAKKKKIKAIIVVHLYGMPAMMHEIMQVAKKYDLPVIEDAAEALGSKYHNKMLGTIGDLGLYSFNGNKIITTSGGGMLVSNEEAWIKKARFLSTQAREEFPHYEHVEIGYNYRMSNVIAGIGRGQMTVIDERVSQRRKNYMLYKEKMNSMDYIRFLEEPEGFYSNRWLTTILINPAHDQHLTREKVRLALEHQNIESRPLWKPMHLQPVFKSAPYYGAGVSDALFENGLCLPSGSSLTQEDLEKVVEYIKTLSIKY